MARNKKQGILYFEVRGTCTVEFETTVQATSAEDAEKAAKDEIDKGFSDAGIYHSGETVDIDDCECVMEMLCAICGRKESSMSKRDQRLIEDFKLMSFEDNVRWKLPFLNGEIVCPEHRTRPGKYKKFIRALESMRAWG